jgi:hypothetical protein
LFKENYYNQLAIVKLLSSLENLKTLLLKKFKYLEMLKLSNLILIIMEIILESTYFKKLTNFSNNLNI